MTLTPPLFRLSRNLPSSGEDWDITGSQADRTQDPLINTALVADLLNFSSRAVAAVVNALQQGIGRVSNDQARLG